MHALTRPLRTIRISLDDLRAIVEQLTAVVPADARLRLIRIAGVRHSNHAVDVASVDEITALPDLPDVLYDLSVSVVATAERATLGATEYRVQLVSDATGLGLQVFSDDPVWAHGTQDVLVDALARFEASDVPTEPARPGFLARIAKPLLAGTLAGAVVATAYYRDPRAAAVLFGVGAVLWYLIDLIFAVTAPAPHSRETPNLQVVIRDVLPAAQRRWSYANALPAIKAIVALGAIAAVAAVMVGFFPHRSPPATAHRAPRTASRG